MFESTHNDILKVYGKPTAMPTAASNEMFDLVYDKIGIAFRVLDPSGMIRNIKVFRPGAQRLSGSSKRPTSACKSHTCSPTLSS